MGSWLYKQLSKEYLRLLSLLHRPHNITAFPSCIIAKEISEVLNRVKVDIVAGQETWERKDKVVNVYWYKWFGKPRIDQNSRRGEGGVGFLVRECIAEEVEFIRDVRYEESVWMKVRGGRGKEALYLCCVYMPTEGSAAAVIEDGYERLKEDVLEYQQKGRVVLPGDFKWHIKKGGGGGGGFNLDAQTFL